MSPRKKSNDNSLRRQAEKVLSKKPRAISKIPPKDVEKLIHELQVHQVELEMQNNELRRAQEEIEASRSKYSDLYDFAPVGYVTLTRTGRIKEINLTGARLLGIERARVVGNAFSVFLAPESRAIFREHCGATARVPDKVRCEVKLVKKNGTSFYASIESISVPNDRPRGIRSAIIDITELKQTEEELRKLNAELEQRVKERTAELETANRQLKQEIAERKEIEKELIRLASFPELNPNPIIEVDSKGSVYYLNTAARELFPDLQEMGPRHPWLTDLESVVEVVTNRVERATVRDVKIGEQWYEQSVHSTPERERLRIYGLDITPRKQMEQALQQSEDRERQRAMELETVLEAVPAAVWIAHDPDCNHITGNAAADKLLRLPRGAESSLGAPTPVRPEHFRAVKDGREMALHELPVRRAAARGIPVRDFEFSLAFIDGTVRHLLGNATPLFDAHGRPHGSVAAFVDITDRKEVERKLKESERKYRNLFEGSRDGYGIVDMEGRIKEINQALASMLGYSSGELMALTYRDLTPSKWHDIEAEIIEKQVLSRGFSDVYEKEYRRKDGTIFPASLRTYLMRDNAGQPVGMYTFTRDITEQKRMEEELRQSEERLQFALETSQTGAWNLDLVDHTTHRSHQHDRIFGYEQLLPQWTYEMFLDHVLPEDREAVDAKFQQATKTQGDWSFECRIRRSDGEIRWIWAAGRHRTDTAGQARRMAGIVQDITERKRAEEVLRRSHDELEIRVQERTQELEAVNKDLKAENEERLRVEIELRESETHLHHLSSELLKAQESERKRIARELHDGLGQNLTAMKFRIESYLQGVKHARIKATAEPLGNVVTMIQDSVREIHRIQANLRPSVLDDLGILATLAWFCREFESTYKNIIVEKEIAIRESEVPEPLKMVIYRVVQEALNNVSKHSCGDRVQLSLRKGEGSIEVLVRDNGKGFNPEEMIWGRGHREGLGLPSMRERAEQSGGIFALESAPGEGTTIKVTWNTGKE